MLTVVEYCALLVGSGWECGYTTHVDEIKCWVDVYIIIIIISGVFCAIDTCRETVGDEMAATEGGTTYTKETT
jgi:hypothetical protein